MRHANSVLGCADCVRVPRMEDQGPVGEVCNAVECTLGRRIVRFDPISAGLTHALTGIATLDDRARVFMMAGLNEHSRPQIEAEIENLGALRANFLPRLVGAHADPPILILEDLSAGLWPEPYPDDLGGLETVLEELRSLKAPPGLNIQEIRPPGEEILSNPATLDPERTSPLGGPDDPEHGRVDPTPPLDQRNRARAN